MGNDCTAERYCPGKRHLVGEESWSHQAKLNKPLEVGCQVMVQTQAGPTKGRWEHSGMVVEATDSNSYLVKLDGSGQIFEKKMIIFKAHHFSVLQTEADCPGDERT